MRARTATMLAAVVAGALLLAACTPTAPTPTRSAKPSRTAAAPSASPTATSPALPDDVLFQITATATAPDGTTAALTETVHVPVDATDHQAGDTAQLDGECDGWRQAFPSTQFLVANVTTKVAPGASWTDADGQVTVDMAGYPVWTGDQKPYQEVCATALALVPGSARAVSPVAAGKPDGDGGWAVFRYGFGVPRVDGTATASPSTGVIFSRCRVQLGTAAKSSIFASTWVSHPDTEGGTACRFGGTD
jgi:hypothetical protein